MYNRQAYSHPFAENECAFSLVAHDTEKIVEYVYYIYGDCWQHFNVSFSNDRILNIQTEYQMNCHFFLMLFALD